MSDVTEPTAAPAVAPAPPSSLEQDIEHAVEGAIETAVEGAVEKIVDNGAAAAAVGAENVPAPVEPSVAADASAEPAPPAPKVPATTELLGELKSHLSAAVEHVAKVAEFPQGVKAPSHLGEALKALEAATAIVAEFI